MENPELSIIIPCYNCDQTLEEALASVYTQNLSIPFEVVLVDDASTDQTKKLMIELSGKYSGVKTFFHDKNQGGGATRNTAVKHAKGKMIFCLDSDDLLAPGTLGKMVGMMQEKNCDGVGISTSTKFNGRNKNDISRVDNFGYVGEKIPFESLFERPGQPLCSLYSTFLFTKEAFQTAGGYPTAHGFDTQGFAFRFLANGLTAYTCPGANYLQRINFHQSYYLREYEAGKINHNWFSIYEEFLYLFSPEVQSLILNYDLNGAHESLAGAVSKNGTIFRTDYQALLKPETRNEYEKMIGKEGFSSSADYYWLGTKKMAEGDVSGALALFTKSLELGLNNGHLYQALEQTGYQFNAGEQKQAEKKITKLQAYQRHGSGAPFLPRLKNKLIRTIKKWLNI